MTYSEAAMRRVTRMSWDNDKKETYKSRVKRKVFHFLLLFGFFLIKIVLIVYITIYIKNKK